MLATAAGATTRATLADLVECHITTLVRESAAVNRHSKRGGTVSAADDDDDGGGGDAANVEEKGGGGGGSNYRHKKRRTKRRMIHHDDVNMALLWRGSEKLYVSGVPLFSSNDNEEGAADDEHPPPPGGGGIKPNNTIHNKSGLDRLLRSTTKTTADADDVTILPPSLLSSSIVPRVDLNAYLASELTIRPPCELKCTLHWLAVEGVQPMIPENQIWSEAYYNNGRAGGGGGLRPALAPLATTPSSLLLGLLENNDDDNDGIDNDDADTYDKSSIRIRELQQRILSEELRLYYERVTSTIDKSNNNNNNMSSSSSSSTESQSQQSDADDATNTTTTTAATISTVLHGLKYDFGLQELVPFLSRYIACGLLSLSTTTTATTMKKTKLRTATTTTTTTPPSLTYCYRLIQVLDAMLGNTNLHLELHLHQLIVPIGTCIVARKLGCSTSSTANNNNRGGGGGKTRNNDVNSSSSSSSSSSNWYCDHWSLREEAARVLVKACTIYGTQYPTLTSRVIKLLTHQALRPDRPLVTQYGGIVGLSYFGPRIVDAFILPIAREYWERYEDERRNLVASCMGGSLGDAATTATTLGVATTTTTKMKKRDIIEREYELTMCQVALLDAIQVFMMGVSPGEQSRRVDITTFADVFGERLIPMQPDLTVYTMAII